MRLRLWFLCAFLVACDSEGGCSSNPGLFFSVLPDFGDCNRGGSTSTLISMEGEDGELYIINGELPTGITGEWDVNLENRSSGTMRFNCSQSAAPGSYDLRMRPYVVSREGDPFDDLAYRLTVH